MGSSIKMNTFLMIISLGVFILLGTYFFYYETEWLGDSLSIYRAGYHFVLLVVLSLALIVFFKRMHHGRKEMQNAYQEVIDQNVPVDVKSIFKEGITRSKQRARYVTTIVIIAMLCNYLPIVTNLLQYIK